jgi:hypothetical protein
MSPRTEAALRWYLDALVYGTMDDVIAADAEVDEAIREERK